jgi:hypothetical protein
MPALCCSWDKAFTRDSAADKTSRILASHANRVSGTLTTHANLHPSLPDAFSSCLVRSVLVR